MIMGVLLNAPLVTWRTRRVMRRRALSAKTENVRKVGKLIIFYGDNFKTK